ncbi:MAG: tRNA (N6-isopentenyl adenosine(37)-C2)-methylthiotransferase MiaB [Lachnospirales bacterium]
MSEREVTKTSEFEVEKQKEYIKKLKEIVSEKESATGKKLKFMAVTFGCQMNAHDSEKLIGMLMEMGFEQTDEETDADIIFYNTCTIRENAENKVYGNLGYLKSIKKKKPDLKVVLCGCMMQQDAVIETIKKKHKHVDVIFGTYNLYRFPELLYTNFETNSMIIDVWEEHGEIIEDLPTLREYSYKASVNIMFGCNNFCTYCIVPYVRGRERSRKVSDIVKEVEELVADGVVEVTLLGQNVNSYGKNLEEKTSFADLLRILNKVEGLRRIRFMTSHPKDLSDDLIKAMAECDKVCNHFHLPMQSGSTKLLNLMNRRYTKESYLEIVEKTKKAIPNMSFTTDIIVGFPGETDEDNMETIDVIEKVGYTLAFTFLYSVRAGTPAATMEGKIDERTAKTRFNTLNDRLNKSIAKLNEQNVGKVFEVLVEDVSKHDDTYLTGRTEGFNLVHFKCDDKSLIGKIVEVKIVDFKTFYLIGELYN